MKYPHTLEPFFEDPKNVLFVPEKDFLAGTDMWSVDTYGTQMNINVMDFDTVLFDDYYNHPDNSLIEKYGSRKLTNRMIGKYRAVDYDSR